MRAAARIWAAWVTCVTPAVIRDYDYSEAGPSPSDCENPANPVVRENCLPGSPASEWDINAAGSSSIQGFPTRMSVAAGERVDFKVKTDSKQYRFDIYRMGYYGGHGARKVASFRPTAALPQAQPDCLLELETMLVDCGNWEVSGSWHVPADACSGIYFARLVREDLPPHVRNNGWHWRVDASEILPNPKFANSAWDYSQMPPCGSNQSDCPGFAHAYGAQRLHRGKRVLMHSALKEPHASHAYFVVRDDLRKAGVLLQTIDTTWHAYNNYGAPSTYGVLPLPRHNFTLPAGAGTRRAYKVSYNVPLIVRDVRSVNAVFCAEYPALRWLEANGYDVKYWSGVDAHTLGPGLAREANVFWSVGHDEYWSGEQRAHVEAARDRGMHLMFLSGNEVYWKVRWEDSLFGEPMRTMVVYKESQESRKIDPTPVWTGTFRDSRPINPEGPNPENALTGTIFTVNAWRNDALEVPWVYGQLRFWRHTAVSRLRPRQKAVLMKGLLGHEFDEDLDNGFRPPGLIRLSRTVVDNVQLLVDGGSCFDSGTATHHLVMYRAASGAIVFGAGTVQWAWGLDAWHDTPTGVSNMLENEYNTRVARDLSGPDEVVQQATMNALADMGVQPATPQRHLVKATASTDTTPPEIRTAAAEPDGQHGCRISAVAGDMHGEVAALEYSVGRGAWHPLERVALDTPPGTSPQEAWYVLVPLPGCRGETSILVRAVDDSLNIGQAVEVDTKGRGEL